MMMTVRALSSNTGTLPTQPRIRRTITKRQLAHSTNFAMSSTEHDSASPCWNSSGVVSPDFWIERSVGFEPELHEDRTTTTNDDSVGQCRHWRGGLASQCQRSSTQWIERAEDQHVWIQVDASVLCTIHHSEG